jgi:hypothetical protein
MEGERTYTLHVEISSLNHEAMSDTVDILTPGACPSASPRKSLFTTPEFFVLDTQSRASYRPGIGGMPKGQRLGVVYNDFRNRGPMGTSADQFQKWEYLAEIDDWALHVGNSEISKYEVLERTPFRDCELEDISLLIAVASPSGEEQKTDPSCSYSDGKVVLTRVGYCILRVTIKPKSTAKFSQQEATTIDIYYYVDRVVQDQPATQVQSNKKAVLTINSARLYRGDSYTSAQVARILKLSKGYKFKISLLKKRWFQSLSEKLCLIFFKL